MTNTLLCHDKLLFQDKIRSYFKLVYALDQTPKALHLCLISILTSHTQNTEILVDNSEIFKSQHMAEKKGLCCQ